jgi:hypothetical protein
MDDDHCPYIIERPNSPGRIDGKVTLKPIAKELAAEHGMTLEEMAKHVLRQEELRQAGQIQRDGES